MKTIKYIFQKVLNFFCVTITVIFGAITGAIFGAITGVLFGGKGGNEATAMIMSLFIGKKSGGLTGKITGGICGNIIKFFD